MKYKAGGTKVFKMTNPDAPARRNAYLHPPSSAPRCAAGICLPDLRAPRAPGTFRSRTGVPVRRRGPGARRSLVPCSPLRARQRAQGRERELRGPQQAKLGSGEPPGKPGSAGKLVRGGLHIAGATALILDPERKLEPEVLLWGPSLCTLCISVTAQENTDNLHPQIIPKHH